MTGFGDHSLAELRDLAEMTVTVAAAAEAGIFRALAERPGTAVEVAEAADLDPRAVEIVLPVLEELGFVIGEGGGFRLTPRGLRELGDPESEAYQARGLPLWLENLRAWVGLPAVLRDGRPLLESDSRDEQALARYMEGMAATPRERIFRVVDACLERAPSARRVLDLGGGPGLYARAFVERGLEATLLDRAEIIAWVREWYGLDEVPDLTLEAGDFREDPLPAGPFDIVLLSNVIHLYPAEENRRLVGKVGRVLGEGGVAAIADFVRGRSSRAARFALVMLLRTEGGNTYALEEIEHWLQDAGLADPRLHEVDADRHMVTAVRA